MITVLRAGFLLLMALPAVAAEQPSDYAFGIPLQTPGREALSQVELPVSVYEGVARSDLGDLRVFNGAGEVVPHAILSREAPAAQPEQPIAVPIFPLRAAEAQGVEGMRLRVTRRANGTIVDVATQEQPSTSPTVVAYLLDLSQIDAAVKRLELDWDDPAGGYFGHVRVEESTDLTQWSALVLNAPLVRMDSAGQRLDRRTIDVPAGKRKYLRLSWAAGRPVLTLTGARVFPADAVPEPARAWKEVTGRPVSGKTGEYECDPGGFIPADRLRVLVPQQNTVADVEILTRAKAGEDWRPSARATVYRLLQADREVTNADIAVSAGRSRFWLLRVDPRGAGIGQGDVRLALGWIPQQVVFAARGEGPFLLAYGNRSAQPAASTPETIVPGYRTDRAVPIGTAHAGSPRELGGPGRLMERVDYTRWLLWGGLVLGVVVLAGMVNRLWRQVRPPEQTR